jgi:glutaredoxin-related protein
MPRNLLPEDQLHPALRDELGRFHADVIDEVKSAIARHPVVVVGMKQNPFPRRARRLLDRLGTPYTYLEYGSYLSQWKRRLALKMWSGWPTFPMIFVNGVLIGGAGDLERLVEHGQLAALLAAPRVPA